MSFRCRQKLKLGRYQAVIEPEDVTLESGEVIQSSKNLCKEKLPDPVLFDINNQLKAGIDLEEVNSKVLKAKRVNADTVVRKYTKKSKEVTDE